MSTPYRAAPPSEDEDDAAIIAKMRPPERLAGGFLLRTALTLLVVAVLAYRGDSDAIVEFLLRYYVPVLVAGVILVLEKPVRGWLQRRYAREVARGIIELEARASRIRSEHEA